MRPVCSDSSGHIRAYFLVRRETFNPMSYRGAREPASRTMHSGSHAKGDVVILARERVLKRVRSYAEGIALLEFLEPPRAARTPPDCIRDFVTIVSEDVLPTASEVGRLVEYWYEHYERAFQRLLTRVHP